MGKQRKLKEQRRLEEEQIEQNKKCKRNTAILIFFIAVVFIAGFFGWRFLVNKDYPKNMETNKKEKIAVLETNLGVVKFKLFSKDAPNTAANFEKLASRGFYDGVKFHRLIKDFMIQTGDPNSKDDDWSNDGIGGPGYQFEDEINSRKLVRGVVAMANAGPNTNGSQFFIVTAPSTPWLDGKHTVFGEVIDGMDVVDKIESVETNENSHPLEDVVMEKVYVDNK